MDPILEIIYTRDLKKVLPYTDMRSIYSYLERINVKVFRKKFNKMAFVFKLQFEKAQLNERIQELIKVYGPRWQEEFAKEAKLLSTREVLGMLNSNFEVPAKAKQMKTFGPAGELFLASLHTL